MIKCYWTNEGKFQKLSEKLQERVPAIGKVEGKGNRRLEKFRRAANVYYDVFNNGLCNRGSEFKPIFGFSARDNWGRMGGYYDFDWDEAARLMAPVMDKIILEAAVEQNLIEFAE
jgi:hypothetical protein